MDGVDVWMEQKCGWSRSVDGVEVWMVRSVDEAEGWMG